MWQCTAPRTSDSLSRSAEGGLLEELRLRLPGTSQLGGHVGEPECSVDVASLALSGQAAPFA